MRFRWPKESPQATYDKQQLKKMIEYLEGRIDSLQPAAAVIDTGGIGYLVNISLNTYEALQGRERARVLVHESIREDAWVLYGFADERERAL